MPDVEVAAICDLREDALAKVGRRFPAVRRTTSSTRTCSPTTSVDAVAIATAVGTHADLVRDALHAGKHVFVEKPLAPSLAEAEELHDEATRRGLALMVGHTFLYSPPVNAVRELIRSGAVGDIYFVSMSRVNLGIHQRDVSVLWDLGPHDFSILRYWLGETPTHVSAVVPRLRLPREPRRRVRQPRVPVGRDRARRAVVARAEQAAPHDRRRLRADGRLRRHEPRAGARSSTPASSSTTRRASARIT